MNRLDRFGRPEKSINYGVEEFTAVEWDSTTTAGIVYLRGDYADTCLIQKVDRTAQKISWAFGPWADRASLTYGNDRLVM